MQIRQGEAGVVTIVDVYRVPVSLGDQLVSVGDLGAVLGVESDVVDVVQHVVANEQPHGRPVSVLVEVEAEDAAQPGKIG